MCCGSRRAAWRSAAVSPRPASETFERTPSVGSGPAGPGPAAGSASAVARGPFPSVVLDYLEGRAIRVRGPVTGQAYSFSEAERSQAVDARDAAVLVRNASFRPAE
jgi:hypothetical protein